MKRVVDNRYTILGELGSGGAGDVFLARDEVLGREVALKMLGRRYDAEPGLVERFEREARSTASLSHPNVVAVHDLGELPGEGVSDRRSLYIVMEYVPGITLADLIHHRVPLPPRTAASIARRAARGLEAAHAQGIIHRDVKPANILLSNPSGSDLYSGEPEIVKVTDFGISRRLSDSTLTEHNAVMGTAHYLSPEQAMGRSVDLRSDLYSLGVVLYEMLAGRRPFEAGGSESPLAVAMKHVREDPEPPASIAPGVPAALNDLTLQLLGKDPEERPGSASDLAESLDAEPDERTETLPRGEDTSHDRAKRRGRLGYALPAAIAALALAAGAVGALNATGGDEPRPDVSVPQMEGQSLEQARRLAGEEIEVEVADRRSSEEPADTVLSADPEAGREVRQGSAVEVVLSEGPPGGGSNGEPAEDETPETGARRAAGDYYEAVDRRDWAYTYENLDSRSQEMFTEEEWYLKNQHMAETDQLYLDTMSVEVLNLSSSGDRAEVNVYRTFDGGYELDRDTVFVREDGEYRHRLVGEELVFFMPGTPYEEFAEAY